MFINHVSKHIRYVGKGSLAVRAAVSGSGVKIKFGFAVECFGAAGASLGDADGKHRGSLVGVYVVHVPIEMRFIRECSRAYPARWCLVLDQVAWTGECDPFNGGCSEGQAEVTVVLGPSNGR